MVGCSTEAHLKGLLPDVYGQLHPVETPELIARKRVEFEDELKRVPDQEKISLMQAEEKCPELLTDDFKLMFLRCEVFQAKLAAERYAHYWDKRVEVFGPEKAFEPLTLVGAVRDDKETIRIGIISLMKEKDPEGRSIIFFDVARQDRTKYSRDSLGRVFWYIFHAAIEDENTQRQGVVVLGWPQNAKYSQFDRGLIRIVTTSIKGAIPTRLSALHICQPPMFAAIVIPIIKYFLGEKLRKRISVHSGSQEKLLGRLEKFGLSKDKLPADLGGQIVVNRESWVNERLAAGL
jgi:hypothetical protein